MGEEGGSYGRATRSRFWLLGETLRKETRAPLSARHNGQSTKSQFEREMVRLNERTADTEGRRWSRAAVDW